MESKSKKTVLWKLFLSTFYLSAFTFGGGYVIVSLMKKKFVDEYHWIDENEMLDLVAIAQSAPGAVAVNALIASAGISILVSAFWNGQTVIRLPDTDWGMVILFGLCIVLLRKCKMNPVTVMFLAGILKVLLAEGQKIL